MSAKKKCEVCTENDHKYKCPQCLALYCSLPCYKVHKESCATKTSKDTDSSNTPSTSIATTSTCSATISDEIKSIANNLQEISDKKTEVISRNLDSKNVPDISDIRSDLVPEEMLKLLGESEKLKGMLSNTHLRELMMNVNQNDSHTDLKMEKLMQEPLFQEFSEVCLNIIQKK